VPPRLPGRFQATRNANRGAEIKLPHPHSDLVAGTNVLSAMSVTLDNRAGAVHENHAAAQHVGGCRNLSKNYWLSPRT